MYLSGEWTDCGEDPGRNKRAEKIKAFYLWTDSDRQQHGEEHDRP